MNYRSNLWKGLHPQSRKTNWMIYIYWWSAWVSEALADTLAWMWRKRRKGLNEWHGDWWVVGILLYWYAKQAHWLHLSDVSLFPWERARSHRLQHCPFESNYFTIASKSDHCPHHTLEALMDSDMGNVTVTCEPNCPFFPLLSIIQLSIILSLPLSFSSFSPLWPSSFFFKCSTHFYLEGVVHIFLIDIEIYKIINLRCG